MPNDNKNNPQNKLGTGSFIPPTISQDPLPPMVNNPDISQISETKITSQKKDGSTKKKKKEPDLSRTKIKLGTGKGKYIASILGILLLVGGIGAGVLLVQQQQDIREKAGFEETGGLTGAINTTITGGSKKDKGGDVGDSGSESSTICTPGDTRQGSSCTTSDGCSGVTIQLCNAPGTQWYDSYCDPDPNCINKSPEPSEDRCQKNSDCANGYICNSSGFCVADSAAIGGAPIPCTDITCSGGEFVCENPGQRLECKSTDASGKSYWCLIEANSSECGASESTTSLALTTTTTTDSGPTPTPTATSTSTAVGSGSPTATSTATSNSGSTPTSSSASSDQSSPGTQPQLPDAGTSWPTIAGVGFGLLLIVGALFLAL